MAAVQLLTAVVLNFVQFWQASGQGIQLTMNGMTEMYSNNSIVTRNDIGTGSSALLCITTSPSCCSSENKQTGWYFPSGKAVPNMATLPYYRTRNNPDFPEHRHPLRSVELHRNSNGIITGIFHCDILDGNGNVQSLYTGIYDSDTGTPTTTALVYSETTRSLTCTSTDGPATTVTWRKNGAVISINATYQQTKVVTNATTGTYQTMLTIAQSVNDISGMYSCTVGNNRGTSSAINTTVLFISVATDGSRIVGGNYSLICSVARADSFNSTNIKYQWFNESSQPRTLVEDQTNLTFSPMQLHHAGQYTCVVTLSGFPNLNGNLSQSVSHNISVQIPNPRVDVSHHTNADMLYAGSRLNITCTIILDSVLSPILGNLTVTSKWTKLGGTLLSDNGDSHITVSSVSQQDSATTYSSMMMFNTLQTSDTGNYTCEVTVAHVMSPVRNVMNGSNSSTTTIKVQNISIQLDLTSNTTHLPNVAPYNTFFLTCTATVPHGVVLPKIFAWRQGIGLSTTGLTLLANSSNSILITSTNLDQPTGTSVLTVKETTAGDYRYRCKVDLNELSVFNKTDVYPIKVTALSVSVAVHGSTVVGENYQLNCSIAGADSFSPTNITYQWLNQSYNPPMEVVTQQAITFNPLQLYHAGKYTCVVTLIGITGNLSESAEQIITVEIPPPRVNVSHHPNVDTLSAGSRLNITCTITLDSVLFPVLGDLTVTSKWTKVGGTLLSNGDGHVTVSGTSQQGSTTTYSSTVMFNTLKLPDTGNYTCEVTVAPFMSPVRNVMNGSSSSTTAIKVQIPPPRVNVSHHPNVDTLYAGSRLNLTCTITLDSVLSPVLGDLTVTSKWTKVGGTLLSNGDSHITVSQQGSTATYSSVVMFNTLRTSDTGNYTCEVTVAHIMSPVRNVMNGTNSSTTTIKVQNTTIQLNLTSSTTHLPNIAPYNTLFLTCTATVPKGVVSPKRFAWRRRIGSSATGLTRLVNSSNSILITSTNLDQPTSTSVLTVKETTAGDYRYRCRVDLNEPSVFNKTDVYPIKVTGLSVSVAVRGSTVVGENYQLNCSIAGADSFSPTNITYQWFNQSYNPLMEVGTQQAITFNPLQLYHAGNYTCVVTLIGITGNLSQSAAQIITVEFPTPRVDVSLHPNTDTLYTGSSLNLTCVITLNSVLSPVLGDLIVTSTWTKFRGMLLSSSGGGHITVFKTFQQGSSTTYSSTVMFKTLQMSDTGNYTCEVTVAHVMSPVRNVMNGTNSSTTTIRVQNSSIQLDLTSNTTRLPNIAPYNTFFLTCTATVPQGVVSPKAFAWRRRNGSSVFNLDLLTDNASSILITSTNLDQPTSTSVLTVRETIAGDYRYRCRVDLSELSLVNKTDMYPINVIDSSSPLKPTNVMHTGVNHESVTIHWTVPMIAYTPETYTVYFGNTSGSLNPLSSQKQRGDNFTATNLTFSIQVTGLEAGTQYYYQVEAMNTLPSTSRSAEQNFTTRELPPGPVSGIEMQGFNSTTLTISWEAPQTPHGLILNYIIIVVRVPDGEEVLNLESDSLVIVATDLDIDAGVPYNVTVVATNSEGHGEAVSNIQFSAEYTPNTPPHNVTVLRFNGTHINVSWVPLTLVEARGFIVNYTVSVELSSGGEVVTVHVQENETSAVIGGLDPQLAYSVKVWASTVAGHGLPSNITVVKALESLVSGSPVGAVVGAILGVVVVVVLGITIGLIACRIRQRGKISPPGSVHPKPNVKSNHESKMSTVDTFSGECIEMELGASADRKTDEEYQYWDDTSAIMSQIRMPIPISNFQKHVAKMHQDRDKGFELEYDSFSKKPQASHIVAETPCNKVRNRFANIFPYDSSRVKLREIPGEEGSDYINASYIDGYGTPKAYIAAQGPLPNSVSDFWRMIWENKLPTVVMLTRCFEGKKKCEQYWPEKVNGTLNPGYNLSVTLTSSLPFAEYEIRKLVLKDTSNPSETSLQVTQLHFLGWPDHNVPANAISMVNFIRQVRKIHPPFHQHPLLVHCSAGVGRTGAFIVLDSMMQRIEAEGNVNIFEFLGDLRKQRTMMVQNEIQYVFIHDALCELIICGDTEIAAPNLRIAINRLHKQAEGKVVSGFEHQFQLLEEVSHNGKVSFEEAKACYNLPKNRYSNKLANDFTRVRLRSNGVEGSDYINGNFVIGYRQRSAYIATQGPLPSTVNDFWRMVWEHQSKCIVMLCNPQEDGVDECCCCYWPEKKGASVTYGKLKVTVVSEDYHGDVVIRKLKVTEDKPGTVAPHMRASTAFTVTHFHFQRWPEHGCPPSTSSLLVLMDNVTKVEMGAGSKAITVMCSDGLGRTGAFICIHSQLERLKTEGVVDIFQSIKSARIQRVGLVQTVEQYILCHTVLAEYVDSLETYANFKDLV